MLWVCVWRLIRCFESFQSKSKQIFELVRCCAFVNCDEMNWLRNNIRNRFTIPCAEEKKSNTRSHGPTSRRLVFLVHLHPVTSSFSRSFYSTCSIKFIEILSSREDDSCRSLSVLWNVYKLPELIEIKRKQFKCKYRFEVQCILLVETNVVERERQRNRKK